MSTVTEMPMPEIRRGRKFEQVLEGARHIFMRDGFEGASVDDIAREAGVSKATIYAYFPDKRLLFTEICTSECHRQAELAEADIDPDLSARDLLGFLGHRIAEFMMSDFGRDLFRLMVGEVARFPELARTFHAHGPGLVRERLVTRLRALTERGELRIEDFDLASDQFVQLCKALIHDRLLLGLVEDISPADIERSVNGALEMFMARYGTNPGAA
ncbi:TetR/AcrR family transcriptional regulator [Pseudogemmobacter sonorensis]|uniref:TetR/AcrR family transcriptional regulator n=1 Tax=Pseudogemmobacter sonorensis TaxID=2989681 RepID=UPI0036CC0F9E